MKAELFGILPDLAYGTKIANLNVRAKGFRPARIKTFHQYFMHSRLKKVFIVDNSEIIRLRIIRLLHAFEDVEVVGEAANAEDARFMLPECNPDFLILDIELSGLNGIGLLEHVKNHLEDLQVCILTNHANPEYRRHCQSLGADYFLDKAMEFEKIMDIISP